MTDNRSPAGPSENGPASQPPPPPTDGAAARLPESVPASAPYAPPGDSSTGSLLDPSNLTGHRLGRFQVGRRLGSGGTATVYQAYDLIQGQTVALKVLLPGADAVSRSRFRQEAQTAGTLQHPHIVRTIQVGDVVGNGIAYIAMELVEGESLATLLDRRGRLSPAESCNLLEPIARALAYANRAGIVHRDVKPSNILLRPAKPGSAHGVQLESLDYPVVPLLSDFGIARALDTPDLTSTGRTIGTPAYMAPEQCAGSRQVDGRSDTYSLGAVLYRCLVGRAPFVGSTTQILHAHVYDPLTIPDSVLVMLPGAVVEILKRTLAKEPGERYDRVDLLAADLARAAGRTPIDESAAENGQESTSTMTLAAMPAIVPPAAEPRTATVLVPARGTAEVTQTRPRPASMPPVTPPPVLPPPRSRGVMARLERFSWSGLAMTSVLALVVIFLGVAFSSGQLNFASLPLVGNGGDDGGSPTVVTVLPEASPTVSDGIIVPDMSTPTPTPDAVNGAETPPTTPPLTPPPASEATATLTPTPEPTETPTPLPTDTPEPAPTATPIPPTPTPEPTATPTATVEQVSSCSITPDPFFLDFLNNDPRSVDLGCANNVPLATSVEVQPFQNGAMVRREDTRQIYVRYANQKWIQRPDTWQEGDPLRSEDPALAPPGPGLFQPERGFGRLWEADAQLRSALGWATAPATPFSAVIQSFNGGVLIGDINDGQVYIFLRSDLLL